MENDTVSTPSQETTPAPQAVYSGNTNGVAHDNKKDKRGFLLVLITISVLIIIGGVVFFFSQREIANDENSVLPMETESEIIEDIPTEAPTPSTKPVDVSLLKVKVMNGTGIAKEAAFVQGLLTPIGFTDIEATNAATTDHVSTEVAFAADVPAEIKTKVTAALEASYKSVVTKTLTGSVYNIEITTGAKLTSATSATATPKATTAATATTAPVTSPAPTATP